MAGFGRCIGLCHTVAWLGEGGLLARALTYSLARGHREEELQRVQFGGLPWTALGRPATPQPVPEDYMLENLRLCGRDITTPDIPAYVWVWRTVLVSFLEGLDVNILLVLQ